MLSTRVLPVDRMTGRTDLDRRSVDPLAWNVPRDEGPSEIARAFAPVWRHGRLFVSVLLATFAIAVIVTLVMPKTYTSTTKMMSGNATQGPTPTNVETLPLLNALIAMSGQQSAETYADLVQENELAERVIRELDLKISPSALLDRLMVRPVTNTAIVGISVSWPDREQSALIANAFGDTFVRQQREFAQKQSDEAVRFLEAELPAAQARMSAAQRAQAEFQSRYGLADVGMQTQAMLAHAATLDGKLGEARLSARQNAASLARVERSLQSVAATTPKERTVVPNPGRAQLVAQRAQIALQLQSAQQQYTPEHPAVITLAAQLHEIDREIASEPQNALGASTSAVNPVFEYLSQQRVVLQTEQQSDAAQIAELERQRNAIGPAIVALPDRTRAIFELQRTNKEATDFAAQLRLKLAEARLERTTIPSSVAVIVRAQPQAAVVAPSLRTNLIAGFALALALALTAVFIANLLDRTIKSEADVERELAVPVLAHIPRLSSSKHNSLADRAVYNEAFLQLFWSMRYASERSIRSIAIVSPSPGEGKSTIALNAAVALAQTRPGVLLIDADLRRPTLHVALNQPRAFGLSDVLSGSMELETVIRALPQEGLYLLPAGSPAFDPMKLLQSERFAQLIEQAQQRFATVLIDTPALNVVYDGVASCVVTDATVLVVAANKTDLRLARRALRRLQSLKADALVGVALNRTARPRSDYSDYIANYLAGEHTTPAALPRLVG